MGMSLFILLNFKTINTIELLAETFLTPTDLFYVRNHLPVPVIDPEAYQLEITIEGTSTTTTLLEYNI